MKLFIAGTSNKHPAFFRDSLRAEPPVLHHTGRTCGGELTKEEAKALLSIYQICTVMTISSYNKRQFIKEIYKDSFKLNQGDNFLPLSYGPPPAPRSLPYLRRLLKAPEFG